MEAIKIVLVPKGDPAPEPVKPELPVPSSDNPVYVDGYLDPRSVTPTMVPDPASLTVLVNKYNAISSDYIPALVLAQSSRSCYIRPEAAEAWNLMRADCRNATGKTLYITSGYRSYSTQKSIFENALATKGLLRAISKYAYPGRSEHQLGLAMDISTTATKKISGSFLSTTAGAWMVAHAHEYGFILRYPLGKESITGYGFEAWHFRYVGVGSAADMHNSGQTLEEYLGQA
jgi:D-alanyl-D-alanine carboxypeptidase